MIINYRYYIISLIAIFLSLAIGIVIGFLMDSQQIFTEQQEVIIREIETRVEEIKSEKYSLQDSIDQHNREKSTWEFFSRVAYDEMIKGKLEGLNIAIIQTTDEFIFTNITKPLTDAGANLDTIIYIKKDFYSMNNDRLNSMYTGLTNIISFEEDGDIRTKLSSELAEALVLGNSTFIEVLKHYKLIEVTGNISNDIDYFIIVGGSSGESSDNIKHIDIPIIYSIKNYNIPVAGVEKANVEFSYINSYKKEQISTVDNIDSIIGQISIVMVITGKEGNYGIKNSAEAVMPNGFNR